MIIPIRCFTCNRVLASKYISSAVIGLTMLLEAVVGPIWAYLFIKDIPTLNVFIGGIAVVNAGDSNSVCGHTSSGSGDVFVGD